MSLSTTVLMMFVRIPINHGFHIVTSTKTWWDAQNYCQRAYGTHLITITDSTMNQNIVNAIDSDAWIGYFDAYNEGHWEWIGYNGSSFTNWDIGEPNNEGYEDCAVIYKTSGTAGTWDDGPCSNSDIMQFICAEQGDYPTKTGSIIVCMFKTDLFI